MLEFNVTVENVNGVLVTTSNRVASELGVNHRDLTKKIDSYIKRFGGAKSFAGFYIPSNYVHSQNKQTYRNYLITKKGMELIIQNSQFTKSFQAQKCREIYKTLGGKENIELVSASTRFELSFGNMLIKALKELNIEVIKQYYVDGYKIDFYIPSKNIAVEYDEQQHKHQIKQDEEREEYIKSKLNCKFIRCDYTDEDIVNVMKVVKEVVNYDKI